MGEEAAASTSLPAHVRGFAPRTNKSSVVSPTVSILGRGAFLRSQRGGPCACGGDKASESRSLSQGTWSARSDRSRLPLNQEQLILGWTLTAALPCGKGPLLKFGPQLGTSAHGKDSGRLRGRPCGRCSFFSILTPSTWTAGWLLFNFIFGGRRGWVFFSTKWFLLNRLFSSLSCS